MKYIILVILYFLLSGACLADGGCGSLHTPGCFIWHITLILGAGLLFWSICLPILLILNFYFELNITYKKRFLAVSCLSVIGLVFVMSSDLYKYIFYNTVFVNLQKYDVWIFTPILYIVIYLFFYLTQMRCTRKS